MTWPNDADGDVLRRLKAAGFDFNQSHVIDFNVDFHTWPPSADAIDLLRSRFGKIELIEPEEETSGYVQLQVSDRVSYELVSSIQRSVTSAMAPFNGVCESWGVLHV